jgi:hypothetical protein
VDFHLPIRMPQGHTMQPKTLHMADDPRQKAVRGQIALDDELFDRHFGKLRPWVLAWQQNCSRQAALFGLRGVWR